MCGAPGDGGVAWPACDGGEDGAWGTVWIGTGVTWWCWESCGLSVPASGVFDLSCCDAGSCGACGCAGVPGAVPAGGFGGRLGVGRVPGWGWVPAAPDTVGV